MSSPLLIPLFCLLFYFGLLMLISYATSRKAGQEAYFIGNRNSPWFIVAFGMIGDSLSGVTFVSVPGEVGAKNFYYLQIVMGYVLGYWVIAKVLLPVYYKMQLTSIYTFLGERLGNSAQQTGSVFFLLSRTIGAAYRLFISAGVLQLFLFQPLGVPFPITVALIILLMLAYTLKGGIKTLVWTDSLQSIFLLAGVLVTLGALAGQLDWGLPTLVHEVAASPYASIFDWDVKSGSYFFKQLLSGAFIAIAMTGLDQNMMQKNLSCRNLPDAQKNVFTFSIIVLLVNIVFVTLGALMYLFAESKGIDIPGRSDDLLPMLAKEYLGTFTSVIFLLGITAATFSSADSVLTTLTTSLYIDVLKADKQNKWSDAFKHKLRKYIHWSFALLLLTVILLFYSFNNQSVISGIFIAAGYTYGPLLGLFAFGLFLKRKPSAFWVPIVCLAAPLLSFVLSHHSKQWFAGYQIGYELLVINGLLTFAGLLAISRSIKD